MHSNYQDIEEAAEWIGNQLARWGRIVVLQTKEKFGEARVYTSMGWYELNDILRPRGSYIPKRMAFLLRLRVPTLLNYLAFPFQRYMYTKVYARAVRRFPEITKEIINGADYPELLFDVDLRIEHIVILPDDKRGKSRRIVKWLS